MSLASWKKEFYPVPASKCDPDEAIEHSLRKWIGLRPENLERHGLVQIGYAIGGGEGSRGRFLDIDASSCALCQAHVTCDTCPLGQYLGDRGDGSERCLSQYRAWLSCGDPEPMIRALEATLKESKS